MKLTDKIELTCEDNMELMSRYPDKYFDLAIVDPPYGTGELFICNSTGNKKGKLKRKHKKKDWNELPPSEEYFKELYRVSKKQIIWGANYFNSFSSLGGALVWYKNRGCNTLSQCEIASLSWLKKIDYVYMQVLTGFVSNQNRIHPTQKPVDLYKWQLKTYAKKGYKILDTNLGAMGIVIACHDLGFEITGCELDKDYYQDGIKRVQNHINQLQLFL